MRYSQNSSLIKAVYNPKAFIPHAASLDQGFPHCPKFPTAASRRSMGRVAVPLWLIILSDQLPVIALVGFYPANKLIGRRPIPKRLATLILRSHPELANLSASYARLRQSTYVLLSRSPLSDLRRSVRLACIRHAASVHPEPGSNSYLKIYPKNDYIFGGPRSAQK